MPGRLEEIENIAVSVKHKTAVPDQPVASSRFEARDSILDRIRRIAGKDSVKRIVPIQNAGDHKSQDIVFDMDEVSYMATIRYNNALTEGWVTDLRKNPTRC